MSSIPSERSGGCLCGAVRYRVSGRLRSVIMCHCTQCQKMTGHVMAATAARRTEFRLESAATLKWFDSSATARRGFCTACGSALFWDGHGKDYLSIAAGTLDDTRGLAVDCHIFVADKGAYYEICGSAPRFPDGRHPPAAW